MNPPVELDDIAVIDNHCHAVLAEPTTDLTTWRAMFVESPLAPMSDRSGADTAFYARLIRRLGRYFDVEATEEDVLRARAAITPVQLVRGLFADARIGGVVIDTGYPDASLVMDREDFRAASQSEFVALERLELLFQDLVRAHASYDDLIDSTRDRLADVRATGFVGFKSIVAYRTGLGIERWSAADARASFGLARREIEETGNVRLGHKPLLDTLLHLAFAAAAEQELPVQFHVGYGDPDVDLRRATPLELRSVFEEPAYRGMQVVLLHSCWPYVREGAYLASVYSNVHLDLSYAIPFLSSRELMTMTRAALAAAPISRLMYSSDGVRAPELHWMGARDGRRAIAAVLTELVSDGDLDHVQARDAGERILAGNAHSLYGFRR